MKNVPLYPALLVCTIIAAGCHRQDDTVTPSSFSPVFHGRVINAGGVPVEGAEIHYIYSMTSSHLAKIQKPGYRRPGIFEEPDVVAHVLRRSVDFVGNTGRQLSNCFKFLRLSELVFQIFAFRNISSGDHESLTRTAGRLDWLQGQTETPVHTIFSKQHII